MEIDLFSPLKIKDLILPNRIVMPPMALDYGTQSGEVTEKVLEHYSKRAKRVLQGGVGMIIVEHVYVSKRGKTHPCQLGIYSDCFLSGLKKLARTIRQKGAVAGIQLSHGGGRSLVFPVAPSGFTSPYLSRYGKSVEAIKAPEELSLEAINELGEDFADAALRALKAGFDLIEIHGAHGYLLNQFYSPLTNKRQDKYGGTIEKRLQFSLEVIKKVRQRVGEETPLFFRLGADDRLPGGNSVEDSIQAAVLLEQAGIDCLDLSGGLCSYLREGPEGFFLYMAETIKPMVSIPVIITGGIKNPITANQIITEGKADLIGVGRSLLKEPEWAQKAWEKLKGAKYFN